MCHGICHEFLGEAGQRFIGKTSTLSIPAFSSIKLITAFIEPGFVAIISCYECQN
jgi:hypothetical protein